MAVSDLIRGVASCWVAWTVLGASAAGAASGNSRPSVAVGSFSGSTAGTVERILAADLDYSDAVAVVDDPSAAMYSASGTANGSRVEGVLTGPGGQELMRTTYDNPHLRHSVHQFADDIVFAVTHRPGIATSVVAFVSDATGRKEVYLCAADGSHLRRVTDEGSPSVCPSISRDAGFLTYTGYGSGKADVYFLDLVSGRRRQVIAAPGLNSGAAISPDGRQLAVTTSAAGAVELALTATDGRFLRALATGRGQPGSPAWSPDGDEIAFAFDDGGGPRLAVTRISGGKPRFLRSQFSPCADPDWSPDGRRVAFATRLNGRDQVVVHDVLTGEERPVAPGQSPSWAADGRHLVVSTGNQLVVVDADSSRRRPIVSNRGRISEPTWTK